MSTNPEFSLNAPAQASSPIIDIRYGQVGLVQVRIRTVDPGTILDELTGRIAAAPHFFRRTPVCLDLGALAAVPEVEQVRAAIDAIRRAGMLTIGLAGVAPELDALSSALSLPMLSGFRAPTYPAAVAPAVPPTAEPPTPVPAPADSATLIHQQTVRSGQRVYARSRDLIVTAGVGAGAEIIADGCVHVYGALRGRAMAGARGQLSARVFCQEFYAELVSIAGVFRVFETIPAELAGQPVQAWLAGEDLRFARVS